MKQWRILSWVLMVFVCACHATGVSRTTDFNGGWRFSLQDEDASAVDYDDSAWRELRLPHDWSVESPFNKDLEGCTAYLPGGTGWYRKHFTVDTTDERLVFLCFDGVYNRSEYWLNGTKLGFQPFGYSPFSFDITPHLHKGGGTNVLAVKVDRTRIADSRWYTGSGIYRNVTLINVPQQHIPLWGSFVTTPEVSERKAIVAVELKIRNADTQACRLTLSTEIVSPDGQTVATETQEVSLKGETEKTVQQTMTVLSPMRWDVQSPHLYRVIHTLTRAGQMIDSYTTPFGIRSFHFDAETGFFLNGRHLLIKGVCLHHDGGLVGAAVPLGVWKRRLLKLREGGCNAIRSAHNPPSEEFLDLCDRMGFLVQNEFYDEWDNPKDKRLNCHERHDDWMSRGHAEFFQTHAEQDLKLTMLRDRNHPSIIQWSIGNEIEWTYARYKYITEYFDADAKGGYFWTPPHLNPTQIRKRYVDSETPEAVCSETAQKLAAWTREMDPTRPVTANCILPSASHVTGYADALDVVGYSYRRVVYDYARQYFPEKIVMGTENLPQWHEWKAVIERPAISGLFLWTGIDYMGEANEKWPAKGTMSGLLDTAGFAKPSFHMYKTLWSDRPHVHLVTQTLEKSLYKLTDKQHLIDKKGPDAWQRRLWKWHPMNEHWNYLAGQTVVVEVYSNSDRVELFLNERSLGIKSLSDFPDRIYKWAVPFTPGRLKAVAAHGVEDQLVTAGKAAAIMLTPDRSTLTADHYDVAHIVAQLVDAQGHPVRSSERDIQFAIQGPVRTLGVDNGSLRTVHAYQSDRVTTTQGRCIVILQAKDTTGPVRVQATSGALQASVMIHVSD